MDVGIHFDALFKEKNNYSVQNDLKYQSTSYFSDFHCFFSSISLLPFSHTFRVLIPDPGGQLHHYIC